MLCQTPKKINIHFSLQSRLILYVILWLTLLMLVITYTGIRRESQDILGQMQKDGMALANAYALSAENAILVKAGLGRVTGEASRTKGVKYLKIIDRNNRVIGHTDVTQIGYTDFDPLYDKALTSPITAVEKGKNPLTLIDKALDGKEIFRVIVPLVLLDQVVGVLEVGLDTRGIAEAIRRTNNQSVVIAALAFLCGGAYIWFFARSFTRPVKELVIAAERIADGDFASRIKVNSRDEVGHLALSFNYMTEKLSLNMENLRRTNLRLEEDAALIEKLHSFNENILNSITSGVLTVDLELYITTFNQAGTAILGLAREQVIGKRVDDVFPEASAFNAVLKEAVAARLVYHNKELAVTGSAAREILLIINTALLYDQNLEIIGIAVTFEDNTEVRQLQKRINESEKLAAMGGLAAGFAHEVRNPLGAIKTSAQFLKDKTANDDFRYRFTELITREVERLDQLVERLLNFTRPTVKDFQYEDINLLIDADVKYSNIEGQ